MFSRSRALIFVLCCLTFNASLLAQDDPDPCDDCTWFGTCYPGLCPDKSHVNWCVDWAIEMGYDPYSPDTPQCPCGNGDFDSDVWDESQGGAESGESNEDEDLDGPDNDTPGGDPPDGDPPVPPGGGGGGEDCACALLEDILETMTGEPGDPSFYEVMESMSETFSSFSESFETFHSDFGEFTATVEVNLDELIALLNSILGVTNQQLSELQAIRNQNADAYNQRVIMIALLEAQLFELQTAVAHLQAIADDTEEIVDVLDLMLDEMYIQTDVLMSYEELLEDILEAVDTVTSYISQIDITTQSILSNTYVIGSSIIAIEDDANAIRIKMDALYGVFLVQADNVLAIRQYIQEIHSKIVVDDEEPTSAENVEFKDVIAWSPTTYAYGALTYSVQAETEDTKEAALFKVGGDQIDDLNIETSSTFVLNPPVIDSEFSLSTWEDVYGEKITADLSWYDETDFLGASLKDMVTSIMMFCGGLGTFYIVSEEFRRYG